MRAALLVASLLAVSAATVVQDSPADVIVVNGRVFTGAAERWAEAVAVRRERITAVGDNAAVWKLAGPSTRVIDAGGRLVIPGINDAHAHPTAAPPLTQLEGPPAMEQDPDLGEIVRRLKGAVAKAPPGGWIFGEIGGALLEDPTATRFAIDPITGGRPTVLHTWHGHGTLLNTAALAKLRVSETEPDPPGGFFARMPDGRTLTGLAHEYASYTLMRRFATLAGEAAQVREYRRFTGEAVSFGITSIQAMMTGYDIAASIPLWRKAAVPNRVRLIEFPTSTPASWRGHTRAGAGPRLTVSGVKYIVDGTPIERFMFLREPYSDAAGARGRLNFDERAMGPFVARALSARVQPMFHAVGDGAIDTVLSLLESVAVVDTQGIERADRAEAARFAVRPRLEHGDMLEPAHFDRAKRLGLVVVQNPSHLMLADLMKARLGPRAARVGMVKSIARAGMPLAFGSDGPMNPFLNMWFATVNAANPAEALTLEEALVAYTRGSAFAEFTERDKGTIEPGKLADLAILSQDIFTVPPPDLPKTTSVLTMVGGRVVHEAR